MADDKKNIPDAGKVDEPPKPGKVEPAKTAPPVQDQLAPAKTEAPEVEGAPKVVKRGTTHPTPASPPQREEAVEAPQWNSNCWLVLYSCLWDSPTPTAHHRCSRQKPGNSQYTLLKIARHLEWCNFPVHRPASQPTNNIVHLRSDKLPKYDSAGVFAPHHPIIVPVWQRQQSFPAWIAGMNRHNPRSQSYKMPDRIPPR